MFGVTYIHHRKWMSSVFHQKKYFKVDEALENLHPERSACQARKIQILLSEASINETYLHV